MAKSYQQAQWDKSVPATSCLLKRRSLIGQFGGCIHRKQAACLTIPSERREIMVLWPKEGISDRCNAWHDSTALGLWSVSSSAIRHCPGNVILWSTWHSAPECTSCAQLPPVLSPAVCQLGFQTGSNATGECRFQNIIVSKASSQVMLIIVCPKSYSFNQPKLKLSRGCP